jgi:hypothetical protein
LLPRWLTVVLYAVLIPLCVFSVGFIGRSIYIQHELTGAVKLVGGRLGEPWVELTGPEGRRAMPWLEEHPRDGWFYLNQELLRDEAADGRMARALALRKAVQWGVNSARREVIRQITAHMTREGALESGFTIDEKMRQVLASMVAERRASPEMTYGERRVTDVLEWLLKEPPEPPTGTEKGRMQSLEAQYSKTAFQGPDARALKGLAQEWQPDSNPAAREAASKFALMLQGKQTDLSAESAAYCTQQADQWEGLYRQGMARTASVGYQLLEIIIKGNLFVDHPNVYQYVSLLGHRFDEVRAEAVKGVWLLRQNQFDIRFLSEYAGRTSVNPFLAVETARLTMEEHERVMRRENNRRLVEAVRLLGRIGVDYVEHTSDYKMPVPDQNQFMNGQIVHRLQDLTNEEIVRTDVAAALSAIRQADEKRTGGPLFFAAVAER